MKGKTHYGQVDRATESDNQDYWSDTLCGIQYWESEVDMSDKIKHVNCKRCLKSYSLKVKEL